jgi:hypothetical protein
LGGIRLVQADLGDAQRFQREEFALVAGAVLVQVAPHAQLGKGRVGQVEHTVAVEVEVAQGGPAVGCGLPIGQQGVVAEQLAARVDGAVAVAVPHQQAIVPPHPGRARPHAIGVVVEGDGAPRELRDLEAIAVEVEHDGGGGALGVGEIVGDGIGDSANQRENKMLTNNVAKSRSYCHADKNRRSNRPSSQPSRYCNRSNPTRGIYARGGGDGNSGDGLSQR